MAQIADVVPGLDALLERKYSLIVSSQVGALPMLPCLVGRMPLMCGPRPPIHAFTLLCPTYPYPCREVLYQSPPMQD